MKADPAQQQRLLDLQAVDTRLDQIVHAKATLPQLKDIAMLAEKARALDTDLANARVAVSDVQRDVDKAEADVQLVRDRATRNQARLDSGTGSAKDLQALQHELESLARRQTELEDAEIDIMEKAEELGARASALGASRADLAVTLGELEAARDSGLATLETEREQVAGQRDSIRPGVDDALLALYEKVRANGGGVGAAELRQRRCGGCRLELNGGDLQRITAAAPDEVVRCEECGRILVRTPESGLPA
ncbi:MAG: C4-type zinc ribbon domain-containing protein [Actinomycetota bacterium]|nr:C4-type zinc ribbon domain-containing protein [Actinomycetota bacterium]